MPLFRLLASAAVLSLALLLTSTSSPAAAAGGTPKSGDTAAAAGRAAYSPTTWLVAASRRGVRVQVVVGGVSCRRPACVSLRRGLAGTSRATCAYRSARWARTFAGGETQLHQKSWTFSRIGSVRWVTVITSANQPPPPTPTSTTMPTRWRGTGPCTTAWRRCSSSSAGTG